VANSNDALRKEWKEANERVRRAEDRLHAAWTAFAASKGPPPDKSLMDEVVTLRRECDRRLAALLDNFGGAMPSIRDPNDPPGAAGRERRQP